MEKQTLTAVQEQEILQANQLATQLNLADLPLILMASMNGQSPAVLSPNSLLKAQPVPEEEEASVSENVKGLIFSKKDLKDILRYVNEGLLLPTKTEDIKKEMPYEDPKNATLTYSHYCEVFSAIKNHCSTWGDIETKILNQGTGLKIFANNFCTKGSELIEVINAMPVYQQAIQTVSEVSIPFAEGDKAVKPALSAILEEIKRNVNEQKSNVENILEKLTAFSATLNNDITPAVTELDKNVSGINLSAENEKLEKEKGQVESDIRLTQQTYNKLVGYAFTGTTGLVFGPLGIISWAITGGIYGSKAEKARKELNRLKDKRNNLIAQIAANSKMEGKVTDMKNKTLDLQMTIENAMTGVRHLRTVWEAVGMYIDSSQNELNNMNDSQSLILFRMNFSSCIESWSAVSDITGELVQLFDETLDEIKKEKTKQDKQQSSAQC